MYDYQLKQKLLDQSDGPIEIKETSLYMDHFIAWKTRDS